MRWLIACLVASFMVAPAMAGQDPYIAIVGNDNTANRFYMSPKYSQFLYDQTIPAEKPEDVLKPEKFEASPPVRGPEICDTGADGFQYPFENMIGNYNAKIAAGNEGWYEWTITLPKKPNGEINICIQCGILKPNAFAIYGFESVKLCAAETGERVGSNCSRIEVNPGVNPLLTRGLPQLTVTASPGAYAASQWKTFNLTAFKNPSDYALTKNSAGAMTDSKSLQVLNGFGPNPNELEFDTRILLKSCMDKCVVAKIPVTGQVNALKQVEHDLEFGDIITVRLDVPRGNTVDVYCHKESLKVMGIGEAWF